jgi:hypothetical protein
MPSTYLSLHFHLVFSTKSREATLEMLDKAGIEYDPKYARYKNPEILTTMLSPPGRFPPNNISKSTIANAH